MPSVFIQTRNGTVSILPAADIEEARRIVDHALDGPRLRAKAEAFSGREAERERLAKKQFAEDSLQQVVHFNDPIDGYSFRNRDGSGGGSCVSRQVFECGSDIIRAEVIS